MKFRVGIETNYENRALAWVLGHPGCFCYGADAAEALAAVPAAVLEYATWITEKCGQASWLKIDQAEIQLDETWDVFEVNEDFEREPHAYAINAWFLHDWKPLTAEEVQRGLQLLEWSRQELMDSVAGLNASQMEVTLPGERWNIAGVLMHVANAEWWYQDRLGLARSRAELAGDPYQNLAVVRADLERLLPSLAGSRQVVGTDAEFWSPRKLLRRAVWHERDHSQHIMRLRSAV